MAGRLLRRDKRVPLTHAERQLVLRYAFVIAIPLATILTVALLVVFFWGRHQLRDQIKTNREAIMRADEAIAANKSLARRVSQESKDRASAIAQAVFNECRENELQDSVLVNQVLRPTIVGLKQTQERNPSPQLARYISGLELAILAREPPGEKDCTLPGQTK